MTTQTVKVPDELKDASREQVAEFVSKSTAKQIEQLAPLAAKDPTKYSESLTEILKGQTERVDALYSAVRKQAADSKAEQERAVQQAEAVIKELRGKITTVVSTAFDPLASDFLKLPESLSAYVVIQRVNGKPTVTTAIAQKFTSHGKEGEGKKRGRQSKWSKITVTVDGQTHEFTSLNDAKQIFLKKNEQEMNYSKASFEKRVSEYGWTCAFTERGADDKTDA